MTLQVMGCMHTLNAVFLLIDTFLNNLVRESQPYVSYSCFHMHACESKLHSFSEISMVPNGIFCSLELSLCDFPVDSACLWFYLVRISYFDIDWCVIIKHEYTVGTLVLDFLLPNCWMMAGLIIDRIVLLVENIRPSKLSSNVIIISILGY